MEALGGTIDQGSGMHQRGRFLLGITLYLFALWCMVFVILTVFSGLLIGDPTYCHPRPQVYEYIFPARQVVCLFANAEGVKASALPVLRWNAPV